VPGLRSGFVAGDAALIKPFLLYRTYHGSAMSPPVQAASIAAWNDEAHVVDNRAHVPREVRPSRPCRHLDVAAARCRLLPVGRRAADGMTTPTSPANCCAQYNVTVLPGSYLAREAAGVNPGAGRIRMALVAETAECLEAAQRIVQFHPIPNLNNPPLPEIHDPTTPAIIETAWENRANLSPIAPRSARCRRTRDRRTRQRQACAWPPARPWPVDPPVDQEGRAAVLPPEGQRRSWRRRPGLLRQGADQVRPTDEAHEIAEGRRARGAAGRGARGSFIAKGAC
jgi:hypothetical protein